MNGYDDDFDGVRYDTMHDGPAASTPDEDERAYRKLASRARALGLKTWDPAEFDRIHAADSIA